MKKTFVILWIAMMAFSLNGLMAQSNRLQKGGSGNSNSGNQQTEAPKKTNCEKTVVKYEKFANKYLKVAKTLELNPGNKSAINLAAKMSAQAASWGTRLSSLTNCGDTYAARIKAAQNKVTEASKIIRKLQ